MLGSITSLSERGRNNRFAVTITFLIVGALLGGAVMGAVLGFLGDSLLQLPESTADVALGACVLGCALMDSGVGHLRVPTITRQVNENWIGRYRGWVYGFGFGFQLGVGAATVVLTGAVYATMITCLLTADLSSGALVGGTFGMTRGLTALPGGLIRRPGQLALLNQHLDRTNEFARAMCVAALVLTGVILLIVGM